MKTNKCETYDFLRKKIKDLHETLSKFIMARDNHDMILSNQRVSHDKIGLGYQP